MPPRGPSPHTYAPVQTETSLDTRGIHEKLLMTCARVSQEGQNSPLLINKRLYLSRGKSIHSLLKRENCAKKESSRWLRKKFDIHANVTRPTPSIPWRIAVTAGHGTSAPHVEKSSSRGSRAQSRTRKGSDCSQYAGPEYTEFG